MSESTKSLRGIKSYVRREGRITRAQQRALHELWPKYGIDDGDELDFGDVFGRRSSVSVEIGFGNGDALCALAQANPENDYLGVEVYRPGIGSLLLKLEDRGLGNVRVICDEATPVMTERILDASLDAVYLFFPDPWPKKRHHKRRLVQRQFVEVVARKLKPGGRFHVATDWQDYAEHVLTITSQINGLENIAGMGNYAQRPDYRCPTRFERRGQKRGYRIWDVICRRTT
ncbi:MAG: tRNA (guanosine(46)-N7)-methyltransferase TrmB [Acidiferrobacterales bacterium]